MIDPRTSQFWRLALQSELIDVRGLSESWESIPPERRGSAEQIDRRLARQAIQLKLITLWQAQQLLAGRFHGFKVGRYVLRDLIGQGGMGRVYLATDTRLDRTVALKILSADRVKNPRAIARFQREAKVGAQLQHENLVRIYDFGESDGRHFLVMEYIEGRTIGSLIAQQGPIPPAVAAGLGRQIALGLEHAHKKGLVHRDVNPYNIMVTYDGTAKLADLGLARDLADSDRFTRDGATVGTFDYVSPEQARHSHSADIRSDIYSLGCTLYHMIAAEVPFATASLPEKLYAHQSLEPTPLDQLVPGISEGLAAGIGRMMRKSPDERFSTPLQVAQMLEPFVDPTVRIDTGEAVERSRDDRSGPEAKTMMIPRLVDQNRGSTTVPSPAPDQPTAEVLVPAWVFGPARGVLPTGSVSASDPDLALILDLGPEPSLSEVLAESRTFPRSRTTPASFSGIWSPKVRATEFWRRLKSLFTWPGLLGALLLSIVFSAGTVAIFAWMIRPGPELSTMLRPGPTRRDPAPLADGEKKAPGSAVSTAREIPPPSDSASSPILVRLFDGSPDFPVNTLSEAINRAIGSRGMVVLRNREPLKLANDSLIVANLHGNLLIRAEEGFEPVLEITLSRPGPFLRSGPDLSVELDGLTVRAQSPTAARSTIIQAAGPLTVRRCDFKALAGSVGAIDCDGGALTVERSRFEGFDQAIKILMYRKLAATIRQTRIISEDANRWGIHVAHRSASNPAGTPPSLQVVLDHCTFRGAGLLAVSGFSERAPLQVRVSDCAIRADALIDWDPRDGDPNWSQQALPWSGRGNHYEIQGKSWILHEGASAGSSPSASDVIADVESWTREVAEGPSTDDSAPGADDALIGPSSDAKR